MPKAELCDWLSYRQAIASELYPRTDLSMKSLEEKIEHNVWEWYEKGDPIEMKTSYALCPFIRKFNHSGTTYAFATRFIERCDMDHFSGYYLIYAVEDIRQGEEICVSYGWEVGHHDGYTNFKWNCNCQLSYKERLKNFNINAKFVEHCSLADKDAIFQVLEGDTQNPNKYKTPYYKLCEMMDY